MMTMMTMTTMVQVVGYIVEEGAEVMVEVEGVLGVCFGNGMTIPQRHTQQSNHPAPLLRNQVERISKIPLTILQADKEAEY